jgi:hypothetical protein
MWATAALVLVGFALLLTAVYTYGSYRWATVTRELHRRLDAARVPVEPPVVDFGQLAAI